MNKAENAMPVRKFGIEDTEEIDQNYLTAT